MTAHPHVGGTVLGVERSLSGQQWCWRVADERAVRAVAQRGLPDVVARALVARGIGPDEVEGYLSPSLRASLPDPLVVRDMAPAVGRLADAIAGDELIGVFGDYDVDGATSAALLSRYIQAVGGRARVYVPDRLTEGYGPSAPGLGSLRQAGARVVVTVDCGATALEPLAQARAWGLDVVVVDHHLPGPRLPDALVVDPNRLDDSSALGQLAAVGVTFLLVVALNRVLRERGWFAARAEPDLLGWLDLVALGTVCDVVPLVGLNRALVTQGIKVLGRRRNVGLAALADVARLDERPGAYHLGYLLGPRINAGGRLGEPDLGVRLLTTEDADEARRIAARLDAANAERRAIEETIVAQALEQADAQPPGAITVVAGEGWHAGVIGIVASRLVERLRRPAVVVAVEGGIAKGSGRSVPGADLGAAVLHARQAGLLMSGGGHPMAAGFTCAADRLYEVAEALERQLAPAVGAIPPTPTLGLDGALTPEAASVDLHGLVERLGPFGAGNAEPRFALVDCRIVRADVVGTGHVRCIFAGPRQGRVKAIAFRHAETAIGRALLERGGPPLHLAGTLRADRWRGEEGVLFVVDDAAQAAP
ncbi:MAG: single-stranded-DNA-specific exonuclease RecJ [Alphaproteobacteria bacterium]|nr:single-stranded-DNA-specific exonuclease RecJ [Alphaproteobacteria bacterium]